MNDKASSYDDHHADVLILARRLAWLHHAFVSTLEAELGQERARELTLEAIGRYGRRAGELARSHVESSGLPVTVDNMGSTPDLPKVGWQARSTTGPAGDKRSTISYCPLAEAWQELGAERIGRLYCYVDQGKVEGYDPTLVCQHAQNVLDGDPVCEIVIAKRRDS